MAVSAFVASPAAIGQTTLDPVNVTATREPRLVSEVAADVVVIDAARIRDSPADSLEDLLRREAGLQLSRNGGPGQSASVLVRGSGAASTLVLIDGVRVGSATLGQAEFESISLAQVDRVEVLRGPGSSLYGADAVGGVVQIFTRRGAAGLRLTAGAAAGGYGSREADAGVSGALGSVDYAAAFDEERSDGVSALRPGDQFGNHNPDRDGFQRRNGRLNLGFTPAAGHRVGLKLIAGVLDSQYDSSEFLPPDFVPNPAPDFRNRLKTGVVALDYRGSIGRFWTTTLLLSRNVDDLRSGASAPGRYRTERDQLSWQNAWALGSRQQLVVAYEHLRDEARAGGSFNERRRNDALVLGYSGAIGAHTLQADLRRDDNSAYGGSTTGRLGWSTELAPGLRLRALAGTTFRAPSFNDLYFPQYGLPTIRPERGRSIEAGIDWSSGASAARLTVYRNTVRDLIGYEADPDGTICPPGYFGCAGNTGRARLQGATLAASHRWAGVELRATVDLLDAIDLQTGERLPRRAAHQETIGADRTFGAWSLGASVVAVGARPDAGKTLGSEETLDLRLAWRFAPQWRLEAKLLNATDRELEPARDYQGLGRQGWIGLRFDGAGR